MTTIKVICGIHDKDGGMLHFLSLSRTGTFQRTIKGEKAGTLKTTSDAQQ